MRVGTAGTKQEKLGPCPEVLLSNHQDSSTFELTSHKRLLLFLWQTNNLLTLWFLFFLILVAHPSMSNTQVNIFTSLWSSPDLSMKPVSAVLQEHLLELFTKLSFLIAFLLPHIRLCLHKELQQLIYKMYIFTTVNQFAANSITNSFQFAVFLFICDSAHRTLASKM